MKSFPTDFTVQPKPLNADYDEQTNSAIETLAEKGLVVLLGLSPELLGQISKLALQPHIREYCPRDCSAERFGDRESAQKWLSRGHALFLLAKKHTDGWQVIGYGWSGPKTVEEVPGGQVTFALRLGQDGLGQKLSVPFSQAIIGATVALFDASGLWLETWSSNAGAVHVYKELGFKKVAQKDSKRPTVDSGDVDDTRLFMTR